MTVASIARHSDEDRVRVVVDGRPYSGTAIDLRPAAVGADAVLAALRDGTDPSGGVRVDAPPPGPIGRTLGVVDGGRGVDRGVLAAVARSRGLATDLDPEIDRLRERLATIDPPSVDRRAARERLAAATADTERLRERVAELRGAVQARREAGRPVDAAEADLATATERLVDAETERIAARQRLDRARTAAQRARDARERRLELEDGIANRRRDARRRLAERILPAFCLSLSAAPTRPDRPTARRSPDPALAELAAYRCGRPGTAVVVRAGPFADPRAAADWLDAPVLMV